MKATGKMKRVLLLVGKIQDNVSRAQAAATNDRDPGRMTKLLPALAEAFDTCVEITGMYDPVEEPHPHD